MPVDVTVIVPVYNTGVHLEPCIASLLAQTLPAERLELLFVDDGSDDEVTPARLDELAAEHSHVRVMHEPPSGWPGKPRNTGIDVAQGDYVFFCDDDDELAPDALDAMVAMARRNDSDIVIGKMVGVTRGAPSDLFARSVDRATFDNSALATGLSVHKMFRTSLLRDHGIRFPETKGRALEDQYVMLQAYFAANVVSIVADRVCYWHNRRPDGGNITARRIDPVGYYQAVRENLDLIDSKAPSAEVRDALLRRQFDHEILNRLREPKVLKAPRRFLDKLLREVRKVVVERFPEEFVDTMPATTRARGAAIRRGDLRGLVSLARRADRVVARGEVVSVEAQGDGVRLTFVARLAWEDGAPITLQPVRGGGWQLDRELLPRRLATRPDTDTEVRDVRVTVSARNRDTHVSWFVPVSTEVSLEPAGKGASTVVVRGTADIDLATVAGGRPLDEGSWALAVRVRAFGLKRSRRLSLAPDLDEDDAMALGSDGGLFVTASRGLGVRVQGPARVRA